MRSLIYASTVAALAALTPEARAAGFDVRIEPGVALPLSNPQSQRFGPGGDVWLVGAIQAMPWLDWQIAAGFLALSAGNDESALGEAFVVGSGPRLQRPRKDGWSPWLDGDAAYVRTGPLDRCGLTVGAGVAFPLEATKAFWLGPYVRYLQVVQASESDTDSRDARILTVGVSAEWASPTKVAPLAPAPEEPAPDPDGDGLRGADDACPTEPGPAENHGCPDVDTDKDTVVDRLDKCPNEPGPPSHQGCPIPDTDGDGLADDIDRCPNAAGPKELKGCPDRDHDGVADLDDQCPDTPGPVENHGCPVYKLVTVTEQKVEISQKIFFAFGKSTILPKSYPLLLEVAKALHDHASLAVRIEGHTDSVGSAERNMALSKGRAEAVMKFLVDHEIPAARLSARGYGMTAPIDTNATVDGRANNRRVEFVITGGTSTTEPSAEPATKGGP